VDCFDDNLAAECLVAMSNKVHFPRSESAVSQIDDHEVDLVTKTETESLFSLNFLYKNKLFYPLLIAHHAHFFVRTCMCSQMSFKMRTFSIDFIAPIIETFVQFS
jgi:hypothetical protein